MGQQLIGGDPEHARLIVAADFNLREARMIPGRQRLLDQSANRKNQLDNLTVTLVLSVLLAVMGVLLCIAGTGGRPVVLVFNGGADFPACFRTGTQTGGGQCRKECGSCLRCWNAPVLTEIGRSRSVSWKKPERSWVCSSCASIFRRQGWSI